MFKVKNIKISKEFPPFIIAEMSANHNQSLKTALNIVKSAAYCGVNAIKIQTPIENRKIKQTRNI